jgi:hypothetical protein
MVLLAFTLIWENITSLQKGAKFWESWEGTEYPKASDTLDQGLEQSSMTEADSDRGGPNKLTA